MLDENICPCITFLSNYKLYFLNEMLLQLSYSKNLKSGPLMSSNIWALHFYKSIKTMAWCIRWGYQNLDWNGFFKQSTILRFKLFDGHRFYLYSICLLGVILEISPNMDAVHNSPLLFWNPPPPVVRLPPHQPFYFSCFSPLWPLINFAHINILFLFLS